MDRQLEYSIRRRAAEDVYADMEGRRMKREARKARLLVDSLDMFYSDVAGGYGPSHVDLTNPYVKKDYDRARAEVAAYVKGGSMPWIRNAPTKKEQEEARRLAALKLTLGRPVDKKPIALEMKIDLTKPHDSLKARRQLNQWRDWGMITVYVTTSKGRTFRFDGRMILSQGKYLLRSEGGKHFAIQDMMLEPEQFEPRLAELGLNFERRSSGKAWDGYIGR